MSYDHRKLGISFAELGALLGTRALLAAQALEFVPYVHDAIEGAHAFNMGISCERAGECGTVSCIGGTMGLIMGRDPHEAAVYVSDSWRNRALEALFYPNRAGDVRAHAREVDYTTITTEQAIQAIDNFLAGRGPQWALVLDLEAPTMTASD